MAKKRSNLVKSSTTDKTTTATHSPRRTLTADEIGNAAGDIWQLLSTDSGQSVTSIKNSVDASDMLAVAAIGWLAREDKIEFDSSGRTTRLSLKS